MELHSGFSRAVVYSLSAHSVLFVAVMVISDFEWPAEVGVSNPAPAVAMAPRPPLQPLPIQRESEPTTEVPPILEIVEVMEEIPEVETPEPTPDEPVDPLLEEAPFEELDLESLATPEVEEVPQEPVGEEPEPVRRLLESPAHAYPRVAAMRRLEGTVLLRMIVDPSGQVVEVEMVSSSGHGSLDRAAIAAARGYRFEAGEGTLRVLKPFTFRLR